MCGHCEQMEEEENEEELQVPPYIYCYKLKALTKIVPEFMAYSKTFNKSTGIKATISNQNMPLTDNRHEEGQGDGEYPDQQEEQVSYQKDKFARDVQWAVLQVVCMAHIKHAWANKRKKKGEYKERNVSFQHKMGHSVEVWVGLATWSLEWKEKESGEAGQEEHLHDCFQTDLNRFGLLDSVVQFFNLVLFLLILFVTEIPFLVFKVAI